MTETRIDLTKIIFSGASMPLFKSSELELEGKNFIFARNGSGKSTLSNAIEAQKSVEFDIHVFKGFEDLIGENENLDAFSLAVNAGENEKEIKRLENERELKEQEYQLIVKELIEPTDITQENIFSKKEKAKKDFNEQETKINNFYRKSAKQLSEFNNPQLVLNARKYNKNNFKSEIKEAKELQKIEIKELTDVLGEKTRTIQEIPSSKINFEKYVEAVNEILTSKVKERVKINRLNSESKRNFAQEGLDIHSVGDVCAFCGNIVTKETFEELESYFSADEVKKLKSRISKGKENISSLIESQVGLNIKPEDFYPHLKDEASNKIENINLQKKEYKEFLERLFKELDNKEKNLFDVSPQITMDVPDEISYETLNELIQQNNEFSNDLKNQKTEARNKLRFHEIKILCDKFQFDIEKTKLETYEKYFNGRQREFEEERERQKLCRKEIGELSLKIESLKSKAEKQAVERINRKLRLRVQWELDFCEGENSGYYRIKQGNTIRSVKKLSTGEKNIIAFFYFIEKLEEVTENQSRKPKLIVFDDPMSSNDDTMQYLIITQLQNLYQSKDRNKFDINEDIMVILTHNVHFYLNVQPRGNFKDERGRTKYDKNHFYRIENGEFIHITSEKEDFKTSYEALWFELKGLYESDLKNSMLNTMRRIIETYIKFNSLNQDKFYHDNSQYLKLFNVNSHSIDDLSAETYKETKEEMRELFFQIFDENGCSEHFRHYWDFKKDRI